VSDLDPIDELLSRLPEALRAKVQAARDGGDWAAARDAILAAAKARPGPRHVAYGRLLLALDEFDLCRSVIDRLEGTVLDDPAELIDLKAELLLEESAARWWSPVPGRPDQRVPTTRTAVDSVREAVERARALGPTSPWTLSQVTTFERAVVWASGSARTGGLVGPLGALAAGLLLALHAVRHGGGAWLAAATIWLASAPLLVWAGTRPQWQVNASVVDGRQSLDDRYLAALAKGPPHIAPFGLAARLLVHGVVAPVAVLWRSLDGRKAAPALVLVVLTGWSFHSAPTLELPPEDEVVTEAPDSPLTVAGVAFGLGQPVPDPAPTVGGIDVQLSSADGRLTGLVATSRGPAPPEVDWPGRASGPETVVSPADAACEVRVRRYDADGEQVSVRTTGCPDGDSQRWTLEIRQR
jgi:hypothetical protein